MGVGDGTLISDALALLGKQGRLIIVNSHPTSESSASIRLRDLQSYEKQIRGCMSGSWHGRKGVAFLLDLAERGLYDPARIVDATWSLDQIDEAYEYQLAGNSVRGVIRF
jgi:Zn-dependent alcohol dehydrogenase